jgi:hypothetical protein
VVGDSHVVFDGFFFKMLIFPCIYLFNPFVVCSPIKFETENKPIDQCKIIIGKDYLIVSNVIQRKNQSDNVIVDVKETKELTAIIE